MRPSRILTLIGTVAVAASPVLAQDPASDPTMNTLPMLKSQPPVIAWVVAAAFLVASLAIAFKNSKREPVK